MNEIKVFKNDSFGAVRTVELDGEPWFVGKDVAEILGYSRPDHAITDHVDDEDKLMYRIDTSGQARQMFIINESGLYSLILSSKLPQAREFKRWVTSEILPAIRRHGAYMTDDTLEQALTSPDFLIQLATQLKQEQEQRKQLALTVAVQTQQIAELKPKANYHDVVLNCKDLMSVAKIAKDYGKSAIWLNKWLHDHGVQYKQGDIWLLYQKYAEQGYTSTKTSVYCGTDGCEHSKVHTYWTQKGRLFIYELLKGEGIFPLIEKKGA